MKYVLLMSLGAITACGGEDGNDGTDETDTTTVTDTCDFDLNDQFPIDGDTDAYYRTTVEFTLGASDPTAVIALAADAGGSVAGVSAVVGNRVVFTPDASLTPGAGYTATLTWTCGTASSWFSVGEAGASLGDPASLVGRTYALDLAAGRFLEPEGVGDLLATFLTFDLLLGVTAADAAAIQFLGALSDDSGAQDMCTESILFPQTADFTANPYFEVASSALPIEIEGFTAVINDLLLSGAFTPSGDAIVGAVLQGSIDTRALVEPLGFTGDSAVCDLVATFLVECVECSDPPGPYCLTISVDNMVANEVPGVTLEELSSEDVAADPACVTVTTP